MPARELSPRRVGERYDTLGTWPLLSASPPLPPLSDDGENWPLVPDASEFGFCPHHPPGLARSLVPSSKT